MKISKRNFFSRFLNYLYIFVFLLSFASFGANQADSEGIKEKKQQALALYATKNYDEAFKILDDLPTEYKDEEIFLILSNIQTYKNQDNLAIENLNKALDKDYKFYKAYYNLGCILAKKNSYLLAMNNFELALKYNKEFVPAYYNLACCQMKLKNYKMAKKNLIKALELNPKNKDIYYNLALCYKELNNKKQAQKMLEAYNKLEN